MMKNKKADEKLAVNKLIIIILAILVLLAILMFIFKVPILEWLRNLPDYTYGEDKEINYTKLSPDKLLMLGCTEKVAEIGKKDVSWIVWLDRRELFMYRSENSIEKIELYVDVNDPKNYFIKFIKGTDILVGEVKDKVLTINKNFIDNYNSNDRFGKEISLADLKALNGSHLISTKLLCKTEEEVGPKTVNKEILGEMRIVILNDGGGRCKVDLGDFGIYGLKDGKLVYFENGKWQDIDAQLPSEAQIKEAEIAHNLIEKEKEIKDYLDNYDIRFCGNRNPRGNCLSYPLEGIGTRDIYSDYKAYYVYEKGSFYGERYLKDVFDDYLKEMNSKDEEFKVFRYCTNKEEDPKEDLCYLAYKLQDGGMYGTREGDFYIFSKGENKWKKIDSVMNRHVYMPQKEFEDLVFKKRIKQELIEVCKK